MSKQVKRILINLIIAILSFGIGFAAALVTVQSEPIQVKPIEIVKFSTVVYAKEPLEVTAAAAYWVWHCSSCKATTFPLSFRTKENQFKPKVAKK